MTNEKLLQELRRIRYTSDMLIGELINPADKPKHNAKEELRERIKAGIYKRSLPHVKTKKRSLTKNKE